MSFLYPLGFLALIGVPVLIIIYIIKNKYTEQVVPSTYLWTLSERFIKRKRPIHKIAGLVSLILQILVVILIAFALAGPVITIPNAAESYCFILDASGSMNMTQGYKTRLDIGKEKISAIISSSKKGSVYTLICAGDATELVYEEIESKDTALSLLGDVTASFLAVDLSDAIGAAQKVFDENPSVLTYLVTDRAYETTSNLEVIDVSAGEENYALTDIVYELNTAGELTVEGSTISYTSDALLTLELRLDDSEVLKTIELSVTKLEFIPFAFELDGIEQFASLTVSIANEDALATDNTVVAFNVDYENSYKTLLVSDNPFYLQAALLSAGNAQIELSSTTEYIGASDYDLYIFDGFSPDSLPQDGAIWIVNPVSSVSESGFTVQEEVELSHAGLLSYTTSSATAVKTLLQGVIKSNVYVSRYLKCGLYRTFTTLLSYGGSPLVFTGTNAYGNREVVFAFDLQDSNFPVLTDFVTLAGNLLDYTFPAVIENALYECGDTLVVNVISNCDNICIRTPLGNLEYPDTEDAMFEYELNEAGIYTITMTAGQSVKVYSVFAALPEEERNPYATDLSIGLEGVAEEEKRDGKYDDLIVLFLILAVLMAADWMVYCYEQYQLR